MQLFHNIIGLTVVLGMATLVGCTTVERAAAPQPVEDARDRTITELVIPNAFRAIRVKKIGEALDKKLAYFQTLIDQLYPTKNIRILVEPGIACNVVNCRMNVSNVDERVSATLRECFTYISQAYDIEFEFIGNSVLITDSR